MVLREAVARVAGVRALARRLGLSVGHVSQVLNGKRHSPRVLYEAELAGIIEPNHVQAAPKKRRAS